MSTKRFVRAALWTAGGALLLAAVVLACAPLWVRLDLVRKKIESAASSALAGPVKLGRLEFSWLPRPEATARNVEVSAPGRVSGSVRTLRIRPELLALLHGRVRFSSLAVDSPDLTIILVEAPDRETTAPSKDPRSAVATLVRSLAARAPGLAVDVTSGRAAFSRGEKIVATVREIDAHVAFPPQDLRVDLKCAADLVSVPAGDVAAAATGIALEAGATAAENGNVRAHVTASAPSFSLRRPGGRVLGVSRPDAEVFLALEDDKAELRIARLSAESPRLSVEGALRSVGGVPHADAEAKGEFDVTQVREGLLSFLGDAPLLQTIFGILRGGTLRSFSFAAAGTSLADLGVFERMTIRGDLAGGTIHLEGPGLDFEDASTDVRIEGALLTAERVTARLGNTRAREGRVKVGLGRSDRRLAVDARFEADLSELVPTLTRAIAPGGLADELALVEDLEGSATGRITLGDRIGVLKPDIRVSELKLSARYRRVPWPLTIRGGTFFYDGRRVGVGGLEGNVGGTALSGLEATLSLEDPSAFEELRGTIEAPLGELYPWLSSRPGLEGLARAVPRLDGRLSLSVERLSGSISRPSDLRGDATVRLAGVVASVREMRVPLEIEAGEFRVGLSAGGALSLAGASTLRSGPRVSVDLVKDAEGTHVRDATIAENGATASIAVEARKETVGLRFKGRLLGSTVNHFLPRGEGRPGRIEGDITATVPRADARRTTAQGTLEALDIGVPTPLGRVTLERLGLTAAGRSFDVTSSALLDGQRFAIGGTATLGREGLALDLGVETETLSWKRIEAALTRLDEGKANADPGAPAASSDPPFAVTGDIRACVGTFTFGDFAWNDVQALIAFGNGRTAVDVGHADLCGISTTGRLELLPGGSAAIDASATSEGPNIGVPAACFGLEDPVTGRYELSAHVVGEARPADLPRAVRGDVSLRAWKGGFGKAGMLTMIMRTLKSADPFRGKEDVIDKAKSFDEVYAMAQVADGALDIGEATLTMPGLTMVGGGSLGFVDRDVNLVVLAYPLSSVDKVVQSIPVVNYVVGKDFLSVAVKVTGRLDDPKFGLTPARDVGRGLVGMLQRTLKLPVQIFNPPSP